MPSLIAAWPAAAAAVVRTYQVPPAGPFLQQFRRTAGAAGLPGFSSRPRIGRAGPCGRTSALLCSAKISAQPVWLLQGLAGLNWNLIFYARILMRTIALSPLIVFRKKLFLRNLSEVLKAGGPGQSQLCENGAGRPAVCSTSLLYSTLPHCAVHQSWIATGLGTKKSLFCNTLSCGVFGACSALADSADIEDSAHGEGSPNSSRPVPYCAGARRGPNGVQNNKPNLSALYFTQCVTHVRYFCSF